MDKEALRIPKKLKQITLWVHPEGRAIGSIFLHHQSNRYAGEEKPFEVLNHPDPFLVLKTDHPEEFRFYNKRSLVRAQYEDDATDDIPDVVHLPCQLHMMDGSLLSGEIRESLPPEHARLLDYININNESFIKLHLENDEVCLVNKAYIVRVTPNDE